MCQYGISAPMQDAGQYPIFRMMNIIDARVVAGDIKYINLDNRTFEQYRLLPGDILFNRTNSPALVGKVGLYDMAGDHVFASYLVRLRADIQLILPEYLNQYLNSTRGQQLIRSYATFGVSQANINAANLKKVVLPLPPLAEQRTILNIVESAGDAIQALRDRLNQTKQLTKILSSELLVAANGAHLVV